MIAQRPFGKLDFQVSQVSFGGAAISGEGGGYGFGAVDEKSSIKLVHAALDAGINLYDTAPVYGFGTSEERLGKAFSSSYRHKVFLVTKGGLDWSDTKRYLKDNRTSTIQRMLEASLRRLNTDYIDLYMVHWPCEDTDIREPMAVLAEAKKQGKIRAIGLCNTFPEDLQKAQEVARVDVVQSEFNVFASSIRESLFPTLREDGIGFMSYGTLDKGILSGTVTAKRKFDTYDLRSRAPWWVGADREPKFRAMEKISEVLKQNGNHTGLELALGFVLQYETVSTALCGFKNLTQLQSLLHALNHLPPASLLQQCEAIAQRELITRNG